MSARCNAGRDDMLKPEYRRPFAHKSPHAPLSEPVRAHDSKRKVVVAPKFGATCPVKLSAREAGANKQLPCRLHRKPTEMRGVHEAKRCVGKLTSQQGQTYRPVRNIGYGRDHAAVGRKPLSRKAKHWSRMRHMLKDVGKQDYIESFVVLSCSHDMTVAPRSLGTFRIWLHADHFCPSMRFQ